jgi:hypothetical protein
VTAYDDILKGAEGELVIGRETVDSMDLADSNAIAAKIDYEQKIRPALKVLVTDIPEGGLRFQWKERP